MPPMKFEYRLYSNTIKNVDHVDFDDEMMAMAAQKAIGGDLYRWEFIDDAWKASVYQPGAGWKMVDGDGIEPEFAI